MNKIYRRLLLITTAVGASIIINNAFNTQSINAKKDNSDESIQKTIDKMSLSEKIGQLYVPDVPRNNSAANSLIKKYHFGSVILDSSVFTGSRSSFKGYIRGMQSSAKIPLMVGTDQEGGTVSRLSINHAISQGHSYPSPQAAYYSGGMKNVIYQAKKAAKDLKSLGINWNYAPDADVSSNRNSFIYARTFGKDANKTADYISKVVPAIQSEGVAATLKHFPGYGSAADTHVGGAVTNRSLSTLKKYDFKPFEAGINKNVDSIMITHIILNKVDSKRPASLSSKTVKLLRNDLNYNGVIVTDSLQMGAIVQYAKAHHINADLASLEAGNDMIMSSGYRSGIPAIKKAVKDKQISMKQINDSVKRVLVMKHKIGIY